MFPAGFRLFRRCRLLGHIRRPLDQRIGAVFVSGKPVIRPGADFIAILFGCQGLQAVFHHRQQAVHLHRIIKHGANLLPAVKESLHLIRTLFFGCIVEKGIHITGEDKTLIFREPCLIVRGKEPPTFHKLMDMALGLVPVQRSFRIRLPIAALDLHAFGIMPGITDRAATAASAKRLFQIILSFFAVCVILEKHIRRQLAVRIAAARGKHLIDFVFCNESGAFFLELPIQGKDFCRDLRLLKPVQNGVGAVKMEPQDFPVLLVSIAEALHFFYNSRQLLRGLQQLF